MFVRLKESYVVAEGPVTISVIIGEGQKGHTTVFLDASERTDGATIAGFPLGNGPDLEGREVRVSSVVTDTNPSTNHTSVTYTLSGGAAERTYKLEYTVSKPYETVGYYAKFRLL